MHRYEENKAANYTYTCIYTYTYTYAYMNINIHINIHTYTYIYIYTYIHTHIHAYLLSHPVRPGGLSRYHRGGGRQTQTRSPRRKVGRMEGERVHACQMTRAATGARKGTRGSSVTPTTVRLHE